MISGRTHCPSACFRISRINEDQLSVALGTSIDALPPEKAAGAPPRHRVYAVSGRVRGALQARLSCHEIKGGAEILATANLKHFPASAPAPYGIEALHPDEFVLRLIERVPARVLAAARDHRQSLKNPPKSVEEYLAALERVGLVGNTVAALRPLGSVLE